MLVLSTQLFPLSGGVESSRFVYGGFFFGFSCTISSPHIRHVFKTPPFLVSILFPSVFILPFLVVKGVFLTPLFQVLQNLLAMLFSISLLISSPFWSTLQLSAVFVSFYRVFVGHCSPSVIVAQCTAIKSANACPSVYIHPSTLGLPQRFLATAIAVLSETRMYTGSLLGP